MKKLILCISVMVLLGNFLLAQKFQGAYFEALGSGGLFSLNYERGIFDKAPFMMTWTAGISTMPIDPNNGWAITFPVLLHGMAGKAPHYGEIAIGQAPTITTAGSAFLRMPLAFGYRHQHPDKKLYWRIDYTPIVSYLLDFQWQHWAGASIGLKIGGQP